MSWPLAVAVLHRRFLAEQQLSSSSLPNPDLNLTTQFCGITFDPVLPSNSAIYGMFKHEKPFDGVKVFALPAPEISTKEAAA